MKLAYFSPLNPQPSGISDYSEELLPYLAERAHIDLFVDGFRPSNKELLQTFRWFDYRQDPTALERLKEYDAVLYHIGNDHRYHAGIFDVMRIHPGVVVFHDFALQDFFLGLARERGDMRLYLDELAACHGEHERARAREHFRQGGVPPHVTAPLSFPLNSRLAQTSEGIVVHSRWGRDQFSRIARSVPVAQIPMAARPPKLVSQLSAERRENCINIASFGLITPGKGIEQTLRALAALRGEFFFHYTLVGADNSYFDVGALINSYGMTDRVTITGHVPLEEFERWILKTDIAVNLRERTVGETSASLCRLMAAGVPAIVSNVGAFAELPDGAVVKVDVDEYADPLLMSYFRRLLEDGDLRTRIGANARRYILEEHNIEKSAARYIDFIREVIARREGAAGRNIRVNVDHMPSSEVVRPIIETPPVASSHSPASAVSSEPRSVVEYAKRPSPSVGMKLAYFSPLNPQASGISDYSEEILPYLAQYADIDLFVDGFRPENPQITRRFNLADYRADPSVLESLADYDAVVYHVGNDYRFHAGIVKTLRRKPGIVVFHDFALHDFFLGLARQRGNVTIYLDEMAACHGKAERDRAEEFLRRGGTPPQANSPVDFPLNCRLAQAAEGIIVHSEWSRERFRHIAPSTPVARINHHITARAAASGLAHQTPEEEDASVRVASFGLITPDKGIESTLRALSSLRGEYDFHYTLVGSPEHFPELHELVMRYGLAGRVSVTGYVSLAEFERHIAETDIAINLRERPVGATSGSLCRIMAAGVAAIVSNVGAFTELPGDAVVKIDNGEYADALLLTYLRRLLGDAALRRRIGANARRHMLAEHNIEESAAGYVAFIRELIAGRARRRLLAGISDELSRLGVRATDDTLMRKVAAEVSVLFPAADSTKAVIQAGSVNSVNGVPRPQNGSASIVAGNGHSAAAKPPGDSPARLPKIEGIDYKRAALEYPRMLDAERSYYLITKPFYNLANKPEKHLGDGMDAETHRHFSDFANMAVALALPAGARILDVGCGSGWLSEYFARLGYDVTGIDISHDLLRMASDRLELIPHNVDHETPLQCRFLEHDIESAPLPEKFDAIICYDSLHHFEDERSVMRQLSAMVDRGGLLFILEGDKPEEGSTTEEELVDVMRRYQTLESPFNPEYLRQLVVEHGFKVVGDYVSANGFFERDTIEEGRVEVEIPEINYLLCKKVVDGVGTAHHVVDSREPGILTARLTPEWSVPGTVSVGAHVSIPLRIENTGDTIWLIGPARRKGAVMIAVMLLNQSGQPLSERHGEPPLPRVLGPGESAQVVVRFQAPDRPGNYTLKVDLVAQHVCWFEEKGSQPYLLPLLVR